MTSDASLRHVLVGTAGHIDHGKTRLVGRLTGVDTDRLPEEKSRGISIDLGFAHWQTDGFHFGVVDVPGHERFVKNMVAGATGVNLALLVVAADDSVMPQTREHLEIMDLLGLKTGVVAITKTDLVEPDFVELVEAELQDLTAETFLAGAPIVPVSSETGEGIEQLRAELAQAAATIEWQSTLDFFRMPIDRVFSLPGHGTIVTGSVLSGEVHAGDTLELQPQQRQVRVRSVQSHGIDSADSGARQRTAVNLAGVKTDELERGQELATAGYLRPSQRLVVQLRSLSSSPVVLKDRMELNLHMGTSETPVRVALKGRTLKPGQRAYAELRAKQPVVATYGQRFILRRISPALTVAGGTVLDPCVAPRKRIKDLPGLAAVLDAESDEQRVSRLLADGELTADAAAEAACRAGVRPERFAEIVEALKADGELVKLGSGARSLWIHAALLKTRAAAVLRAIRGELAAHQPRRALPKNTLLTACRGIADGELLEALFAHLLKSGELVQVGENLGPADAQVKLTKNQRQVREQILSAIAEGELMPPTLKELAAATGAKTDEIATLLTTCAEDGLLIRVTDDLHYTPEAVERARSICEDVFNESDEATMQVLREAWGVSRKFSVPLGEYFDAQGVTVRKGDVRVRGPKLGEPLHV